MEDGRRIIGRARGRNLSGRGDGLSRECQVSNRGIHERGRKEVSVEEREVDSVVVEGKGNEEGKI